MQGFKGQVSCSSNNQWKLIKDAMDNIPNFFLSHIIFYIYYYCTRIYRINKNIYEMIKRFGYRSLTFALGGDFGY